MSDQKWVSPTEFVSPDWEELLSSDPENRRIWMESSEASPAKTRSNLFTLALFFWRNSLIAKIVSFGQGRPGLPLPFFPLWARFSRSVSREESICFLLAAIIECNSVWRIPSIWNSSSDISSMGAIFLNFPGDSFSVEVSHPSYPVYCVWRKEVFLRERDPSAQCLRPLEKHILNFWKYSSVGKCLLIQGWSLSPDNVVRPLLLNSSIPATMSLNSSETILVLQNIFQNESRFWTNFL